MIYQSNTSTSDNQQLEIDALNSLLTTLNSIYGADGTENSLLGQILTALTGAATAAKQDTGNTSLATIATNQSAQATAANQATVIASLGTIATNQATQATAANQATQATAAKQDTGNTSLASIDSKLSASSASITSVSRSTTSQSVLAANANRKGLYLYNNTAQAVFVAFAATATTAAFTFVLAMNAGYESSQGAVYKGAISAIWAASGSGALLITELT